MPKKPAVKSCPSRFSTAKHPLQATAAGSHGSAAAVSSFFKRQMRLKSHFLEGKVEVFHPFFGAVPGNSNAAKCPLTVFIVVFSLFCWVFLYGNQRHQTMSMLM